MTERITCQSKPLVLSDLINEELSIHTISRKTVSFNIFEKEILEIKKIEEKIFKTIIQVMSTKKLYLIRQNFRKMILSILNLNNIEFYIFHDTGRIQFHDFKSNFITQILQSNQKRKLLQIALGNTASSIQNINLQQHSVFKKLFSLNLLSQKDKITKYTGQINKKNDNFSIVVLYTAQCHVQDYIKTNVQDYINEKILQRIVKISLIEVQQETQYDIIQFYCKQLLDILQWIVNESEQKTIKQFQSSKEKQSQNQKSFVQIVKNVSKSSNSQNIIEDSLRYQQFRFQLLEKLRMYSKYLCEKQIIFMNFDSSGTLDFLINNKKNSQFNALLSKLILTDELCIEKIFYDNSKLQNHIKKAISGGCKNKKQYQIDNSTKVRVTQNQDDQIQNIQILIEQSSLTPHSSCSTSTLGEVVSKKKNSTNSDSVSLGKQNNSSTSLVNKLQKQNPGIMEQGWLNLFIKDHEIKRKNNLMIKKKRSLFAKSQHNSNSSFTEPQLDFNEIEALKSIDIYSPDTNLLNIELNHLQLFVKKVFSELNFFTNSEISNQKFNSFLQDLNQGYQIHNNPFHNFIHGVNVMHTCFLICSMQKNEEILTPLKKFSTVLSGLCHDVGHTGRTNSFQIASKSQKAMTYNDLSPLQNFHASFTFQILRRPENNFLDKLPNQQWNQIRKDIISNILYTDIKEHFPLLKKFKAIQFKPQDEKNLSPENTNILTGMIVHTSDFGGSAKQFQICREWSRRVNIEFSAQYKQEGQLGIPQTPFLKDLNITSIMAKNQMGFLKVIVFPLYEAMDVFYQNQGAIKKLKQYVQQNVKKWEQVHLNSQQQKQSIQQQKSV